MYDYVNDHGGINGRKIDYRVEGDGYNPTRTVEVVKQLVLQDEVFAIVGGLGTPTHSKDVDYLNSEGVPDLLVSSGALLWDDRRCPRRPSASGSTTPARARSRAGTSTSTCPGRGSACCSRNDDVGQDAQQGLDQFVKGPGGQPAEVRPGEHRRAAAAVRALRDSGAQVVVCSCVPAFTALAILTAARPGFHSQFVVSSIGADPTTLTGLLQDFAKRGGADVSAPALLNGLIGTGYLPDVAGDDPWIALIKQVHDKYVPDEPFTNTIVFGMAQAYTFAHAVKLAGRDLTRAKLVEAMESGKISGPGVTPFGFSESSHSGYTGAYVFQVNPDTSTKQIRQPMVTDRGSGEVTPAPAERSTPADIGLV